MKKIYKQTCLAAILSVSLSSTPVFSQAGLIDLGQTNWGTNLAEGTSMTYVLIIGSGITLLVATVMMLGNMNNRNANQVIAYLQSNHTILAKDFTLSEGIFFQDLASALSLTKEETELLQSSFDGSSQQLAVVDVLSRPITEDAAVSFVSSISSFMVEKFGADRCNDIYNQFVFN